jgi:hypothetical protein
VVFFGLDKRGLMDADFAPKPARYIPVRRESVRGDLEDGYKDTPSNERETLEKRMRERFLFYFLDIVLSASSG